MLVNSVWDLVTMNIMTSITMSRDAVRNLTIGRCPELWDSQLDDNRKLLIEAWAKFDFVGELMIDIPNNEWSIGNGPADFIIWPKFPKVIRNLIVEFGLHIGYSINFNHLVEDGKIHYNRSYLFGYNLAYEFTQWWRNLIQYIFEARKRKSITILCEYKRSRSSSSLLIRANCTRVLQIDIKTAIRNHLYGTNEQTCLEFTYKAGIIIDDWDDRTLEIPQKELAHFRERMKQDFTGKKVLVSTRCSHNRDGTKGYVVPHKTDIHLHIFLKFKPAQCTWDLFEKHMRSNPDCEMPYELLQYITPECKSRIVNRFGLYKDTSIVQYGPNYALDWATNSTYMKLQIGNELSPEFSRVNQIVLRSSSAKQQIRPPKWCVRIGFHCWRNVKGVWTGQMKWEKRTYNYECVVPNGQGSVSRWIRPNEMKGCINCTRTRYTEVCKIPRQTTPFTYNDICVRTPVRTIKV